MPWPFFLSLQLKWRRGRMRIKSFQVRHFRSIERGGLTQCGGLNVLIGKNNAGKSNLLSGIEIFLRHLRRGVLSSFLPSRRPVDEFTDRDTSKPLRIAIEFELPSDLNEGLR